ncbi:MAG: hypothetical protein QME14_00835 [Methanobacteriaceae archaeon]|nr:hypothetical protein [Methanobacteriaceae archaeon]
MQVYMRSLDTSTLPNYEPFWFVDIISIWLDRVYIKTSYEELVDTFKDDIIFRKGINNENFISVVDEIYEMDFDELEVINKKYPLEGICCVEWEEKISAEAVNIYCFNRCHEYVYIFEGELIGECYNFEMQYSTLKKEKCKCVDYDKIAQAKRIIKIYKKNQGEYKEI